MREIKFRAWDIKNNKWYKPILEAFRGNLYELNMTMKGSLSIRTMKGTFGTMPDETKQPPTMISDMYTIEQYTGKKDKNGKEIYEGDNLQYNGSPVYTVKWQDDSWMMCGTKNGNGFCVKIPDFIQIIGTIHET